VSRTAEYTVFEARTRAHPNNILYNFLYFLFDERDETFVSDYSTNLNILLYIITKRNEKHRTTYLLYSWIIDWRDNTKEMMLFAICHIESYDIWPVTGDRDMGAGWDREFFPCPYFHSSAEVLRDSRGSYAKVQIILLTIHVLHDHTVPDNCSTEGGRYFWVGFTIGEAAGYIWVDEKWWQRSEGRKCWLKGGLWQQSEIITVGSW
jgi:hypothetical protein